METRSGCCDVWPIR